MNTANLQLEGLYLVIASLTELLVSKGLVTREEVGRALSQAEQTAVGDYNVEAMSPANRDAVAFAARLLQLANNGSGDDQLQPFSELAKLVGETKSRYQDQR
jgi:hypothetical protein